MYPINKKVYEDTVLIVGKNFDPLRVERVIRDFQVGCLLLLGTAPPVALCSDLEKAGSYVLVQGVSRADLEEDPTLGPYVDAGVIETSQNAVVGILNGDQVWALRDGLLYHSIPCKVWDDMILMGKSLCETLLQLAS